MITVEEFVKLMDRGLCFEVVTEYDTNTIFCSEHWNGGRYKELLWEELKTMKVTGFSRSDEDELVLIIYVENKNKNKTVE